MESLYNMINVRLFGSKLPDCTIMLFDGTNKKQLKRLRLNFNIMGVCIPSKKYTEYGFSQDHWIIGLDENLTSKEYFDTLVHEMIHIWQGETSRNMGHGKSFKKMCDLAYEEFYL